MPELPEVETIRRSLLARVERRRVLGVETSGARLRGGLDPVQWPPLVGQRLDDVVRRGKYLLMRWDGRRLVSVFHLGMSGRILVVPVGATAIPHTHLALRVDGDLEVRFVDPRRFGVALTMEAGAVAEYPALVRLGVEPLSREACAALTTAARRSRSPIRAVLLDQRVLAGVGNIYANEALAVAGIHPGRRASAISVARLQRLAGAVAEVLEAAVEQGGTTLADGGYVDAGGQGGYFAVRLRVYGREGLPCRNCGGTVTRRVMAGRSVFFCPHCQR